jgi:hypothetical protein
MLEVKRLEVEYLDTPEFIDFANKSRTTPQPGRNCNFDYSIDMMIARVKKEIGLAEIPKYAYGLFIDNVLKSVTSVTEINDFAYYIDHFAPICSTNYTTEYDQLIAYIIDDMISKNFKVAYVYSSKDFYEQWSSGLSDDFVSKNRITVLETVPANGIIREPLISKRNPYYNNQVIPSIHGDVEPSSIHPSMEVDSVVLHINYQF